LGFKHYKQIPAGLPVYIVRIQTLTEDKPIVACGPSYEKHKIAVELLKLNTTVTHILNSGQLAAE